jgi:hypothetical protein
MKLAPWKPLRVSKKEQEMVRSIFMDEMRLHDKFALTKWQPTKLQGEYYVRCRWWTKQEQAKRTMLSCWNGLTLPLSEVAMCSLWKVNVGCSVAP